MFLYTLNSFLLIHDLSLLWFRDHWRSLNSSLASGCAEGKKGKKQGQVGKISASEAAAPFPSPDYLSARFARRFFFLFPPMRSLVCPRLTKQVQGHRLLTGRFFRRQIGFYSFEKWESTAYPVGVSLRGLKHFCALFGSEEKIVMWTTGMF